jgi:IS5 family transposase
LFRWFTGLGIDDPVWDVTVFTKNRDRLLKGDIAAKFFQAVLRQPEVKALLSDEHFTVDGTLIEAWASMKSFKPKDGPGDGSPPGGGGRNAERDFHGEQRSNATHASTTDPDARLIRRGRGKEARLCHMGHLLMENQSGLIVDAVLTAASGTAERAAAEAMLARQPGRRRLTLGADKGYDAADFVAAVRALNVTPHIAQNTKRRSAIDGRTTRHLGYAVSQRIRKRVEEAFGWIKTTGGFRKTRHRGIARVGWMFTLTVAACNLVRLPKLLEAT